MKNNHALWNVCLILLLIIKLQANASAGLQWLF